MKPAIVTVVFWTIFVSCCILNINCRGGVMYVRPNENTIPQEDLEEAAEIVNECLHNYDGQTYDTLSKLGEFRIRDNEFTCHATTVLGCFIPPARVEFTMSVNPHLRAKHVKASVLPHELLHLAIFHMGNVTADLGHAHPCFQIIDRLQIENLCIERGQTIMENNPKVNATCKQSGEICVCSIEPVEPPKPPCHRPDRSCK
jgi:hypothetical protein